MTSAESQHIPAWNESAPTAKVRRYKQTPIWVGMRESWLGDWTRSCRKFRREMSAWAKCRPVAASSVEKLAESIALLQSQSADSACAVSDSESPIFLLSTGWRAGSTLLQRILITDARLFLWGEPLGEMTIVSRIAEMISNFISPRNLGLWRNQYDLGSPTLATSWVANLYPSGSDLRSALRSLFDQWLAKPAQEHGFTRWGFKEVRLGATEASLLHWLYPEARFVIISRHPYDCYRSLADSHWGHVYYRYPDVHVNSAASFAQHWNRLAMSWSQLPAGFPCFHIKYEDLISGKVDFRKLELWLGIQLREGMALSASVGGTAKRSRLTWYERWIIGHEARQGMQALGYPE